MLSFSAVIYKLGIDPVVDPPHEVLNLIFEQAGRSVLVRVVPCELVVPGSQPAT